MQNLFIDWSPLTTFKISSLLFSINSLIPLSVPLPPPISYWVKVLPTEIVVRPEPFWLVFFFAEQAIHISLFGSNLARRKCLLHSLQYFAAAQFLQILNDLGRVTPQSPVKYSFNCLKLLNNELSILNVVWISFCKHKKII